MITFSTKDNVIFTIDNALGLQSKFLSVLLENDETVVLPLDISSEACAKLIAFLEKHKDCPLDPLARPLAAESLLDVLPVWDTVWVESLQWQHLQEIVLAANYLDIGSLLDVTCARIALFLRDKNVSEIRNFFNVREEFTPDELAAIELEQRQLKHELRVAQRDQN